MNWRRRITEASYRLKLRAGSGGHVPFGSKADIATRPHNVRFTPKSGHQNWFGLRSAQQLRELRDIHRNCRALAGCTPGTASTFRFADVLDMIDFRLVTQFFQDREHRG